VQIRELKGKLSVNDNLIVKKNQEIEAVKTKLEKKEALDQKHLIRDR